MKKINIIFAVLSFLLISVASYPQDTISIPSFSGVRLEQADVQPLQNAVILIDSVGNPYVNLTMRINADGTFFAGNGTGIDGATLIAFKNLTAAEVAYLTAFIAYRSAKHGIDN